MLTFWAETKEWNPPSQNTFCMNIQIHVEVTNACPPPPSFPINFSNIDIEPNEIYSWLSYLGL